jgi:hypothetical protein
MRLTRSPIVAAAFLLGCAAGATAGALGVPPAAAQNVPRWDHYCVTAWGPEEVTATASRMGADGWEMVAAATTNVRAIWCFKRPL